MSRLQVKLFPSDNTGCGHYRTREPARAVNASSADVDALVVFEEENREHQLDILLAGHLGSDLRVVRVEDPGCDVVVLQRPMYHILVETIPFLKEHGVAVVIEMDDNFHRIHPKNPAHMLTRADVNPATNILWLEKALGLADLIVVSTPALAKFYGSHGPTRVVRNYVPESTVRESAPVREDVVLGWTGHTATHPGDLETIGSAVADVMSSAPETRFCAVGDRLTLDILGVSSERSTVDHRRIPIEEFHTAIDPISVGIVPLAGTPFNECKSYIKGLEYASRGVPFVASPTAEYEYLAKFGAGDLARTERKWVTTLARLAIDDDYRSERSEAALMAAKQLTIEEHVDEWIGAWADAVSMRRR